MRSRSLPNTMDKRLFDYFQIRNYKWLTQIVIAFDTNPGVKK